ncbi:MAG: hypothetical protein GX556_18585 [Fibrobacter sp.]|nr:hypothetical protein [Fibrobacter sp.]
MPGINTVNTYLAKVKPINDELSQFLTLFGDSRYTSIEQVFEYLRQKYDCRDYVIGSIKFVPTSFALENDGWELFGQKLSEAPFSLN